MNKVQVMLVILITVFLSRAIDVRETSIKDICRDLNDNENNTFEKAKRDKMNLVLEEIMKEDKVIYKKKDSELHAYFDKNIKENLCCKIKTIEKAENVEPIMNELKMLKEFKETDFQVVKALQEDYCFYKGNKVISFTALREGSIAQLLTNPPKKYEDYRNSFIWRLFIISYLALYIDNLHDSNYVIGNMSLTSILYENPYEFVFSDLKHVHLIRKEKFFNKHIAITVSKQFLDPITSAPELLKHGQLSKKSNLYSFGINIAQIILAKTKKDLKKINAVFVLKYLKKNCKNKTKTKTNPTLFLMCDCFGNLLKKFLAKSFSDRDSQSQYKWDIDFGISKALLHFNAIEKSLLRKAKKEKKMKERKKLEKMADQISLSSFFNKLFKMKGNEIMNHSNERRKAFSEEFMEFLIFIIFGQKEGFKLTEEQLIVKFTSWINDQLGVKRVII